MITTGPVRLATLVLAILVLAGRTDAAAAQEPPLLKLLYSFDMADPPVDAPQLGLIAAANDGSVINLVLEDTAGPTRIRRFAADGRLLAAWGGTGRHDGRFERPQDVTVTRSGEIWVLDRHRLQRFAADGSLKSVLPWPPASTADAFGGRLAAAPDGGLAVSAPDGHIWLLGRQGEVTGGWVSAADPTSDTFGPSDLAVMPDGSVSVVHAGSPHTLAGTRGQSQLRRFAPDGRLLSLRRFGPFGDEAYAFLDRVAAAPDGRLLTLGDGAVQLRDADGRAISSWPVSGIDIVAAPDGTVFVQRGLVSNDDLGILLHFSAGGRLLGTIGRIDRTTEEVDAGPVNPQPAPDGRIFSFETRYDHAFSQRLRWFDAMGQPVGPALEWAIGAQPAPFGDCPYRGTSFACANRAVLQSDGTLWATDLARQRLLHLAADGRILAAERPLDAQMQPVVHPRSAGPGGILYRSATDELLLVGGDEGRQLYRYDAQLRLKSVLTAKQPDARFWAAQALEDGGVAALLSRSAAAGARDMTVEVSDAKGALAASFQVPSRTSSLTQAPDGSLWLFLNSTDGIARFSLGGEPLLPVAFEPDASLWPRNPNGVIDGSAFGPDGRLVTHTEVAGLVDLAGWRVRDYAGPWFAVRPLSITSRATLGCLAGCRDPRASADIPGASLIAERAITVPEVQWLLVHARGDLRLWVDEHLVVDQRDRGRATIDRTIVLAAGRHRLEVEFSAIDDRAELSIGLPEGALTPRVFLPALNG